MGFQYLVKGMKKLWMGQRKGRQVLAKHKKEEKNVEGQWRLCYTNSVMNKINTIV